MGIGMLACILKMGEWDESALFFDGSSVGELPLSSSRRLGLQAQAQSRLPQSRLGLFLIGIILYISVTLPTLGSVVSPSEVDTLNDQREALSVLMAGNSMIIFCLVGILVLQVRRLYTLHLLY